MNRDNVQATINVLRRAQNFNISSFQAPREEFAGLRVAQTEEELHKCGNSACIAGYVAVSPEWAIYGGGVARCDGMPKHPHFNSPAKMMAVFWGLAGGTAATIIYGGVWSSLEFPRWVEAAGLSGMPADWEDMTKEQAISLFEQLLDMDANWIPIPERAPSLMQDEAN
jgi:hypothetical protein